jgi:hypothetical protein
VKKLLVVTFSVPPTPGANPPRAQHLARHLPEFGWEAIILTPRHPHREKGPSKTREHRRYPIPLRRITLATGEEAWLQETGYEDILLEARKSAPAIIDGPGQPGLYGRHTPTDEELALEAPPEITSPLRRFRAAMRSVPDARAGWVLHGVLAARAVCETLQPDAVYSVSPSVSAHRIAMRAAENVGIPWVADHLEPWRGALPSPVDQLIRLRILRHARRVSLPRSFDERDLPHFPRAAQQGASLPLTLVHAGGLATRGRSSRILLDALRRLREIDSVTAGELRVRLVGPQDSGLTRAVGERSLAGIVTIERRIPWEMSLEMQSEADAVLIAAGPGDLLRVPDRLVEAMAVRRTVLAFGPEPNPSFEELLRTSGLGSYHTSDLSLAGAIRERIAAPGPGDLVLNEAAIAPHRARNVTARIVELIKGR